MARRDGGKQTRAGRSSCRRLPAAAAATAASLGMSSFSSKTRRRRTARWKGGRAVIAAGFLLWTGGASAQFTDGGDISMSCGDCDCSGSSDAGTVTVFENPSSGGKVALVEGELTEVVETSCGKSVIAVGTTIFELSGVDFGSRELEVVDLSSGDCTISTAPSSANCYSGTTSRDLSGTVKLDLTFCLCSFTDSGGSQWNVNVKAEVSGASEVSIPGSGLGICPDNGYISQLVTAEIDGDSYLFNFDLAQPGEDSSADLSVGSGPSSGAQAFICGEEAELEPEPEEEEEEVVEEHTPSPVPIPEEPEEPETPAPSSPAVEEPVPDTTPAPVDAAPETPQPVDSTATTTSSTGDSSTGAGTTASSGSTGQAEAETPAPAGATRGLGTPAPSAAAAAPGAGGDPSAAPVAAAATGAPAAATTPAPTLAPTRAEETLAPLTEAELEQIACKFPTEDPCTPTTPVANITKGLGAYYDPTCSGVGCGVGSSGMCRTCYFDTLLYKEQLEGGNGEVQIPDYAQCPCCVLEVYDEPFAQDEDGPRCANATPAPTTTALDTETRGFESLGFEDNPLTLAGGEAFALGALGLFALLTFLPFCTK